MYLIHRQTDVTVTVSEGGPQCVKSNDNCSPEEIDTIAAPGSVMLTPRCHTS